MKPGVCIEIRRIMVLWVVFVALLALTLSFSARANPRYAAIVVDVASGEVLHAADADATRYPASLTKMMTLYLLFEALEEGRMSLDQALPVSAHAASMPASKLWLSAGSSIKVREAIPALIVRSANDVAVVVAEVLGGTETGFARQMTEKAKAMGMGATQFRNASGLPDGGQVSTARDMVTLSMRLMQDFPQYYHHFSSTRFSYQGKEHTGHNRLLKNYDGADGLKTGYIRASGFNVATSAMRDGRRIIAVVMGGITAQSRDAHTVELLDSGFVRASLLADSNWMARAETSGNVEPIQAASPASAAQPDRIADQARVAAAVPVPPAEVEATPKARVEASFMAAAEILPGEMGSTMTDTGATPADDPILALVNRFENEPQGDWAVQVGAFRSADLAQDLASRAADYLQREQVQARAAVTEAPESEIYRARLIDMQEGQAHNACNRLMQQGMDCMVVK